MRRTLTYGMVGGGIGAFIGDVHRKAIALDGTATLVAGCLSSDADRARESARALGLPADRAYATFEDMARRESARPDRIDFVSIVTPNDTHFAAARAFLDAGIHVVLDKPMTHTSAQARELGAIAARHGLILAVTYNYAGYPMVREAARLVREGAIGEVRKVFVEYHQGWLATRLEQQGQKQAAWRTDPARAGAGGAIGDIGTHAENLVQAITGLEIDALLADATAFAPGRPIDDDAAMLLRFAPARPGGPPAKGVLTCSQVCVGEANALAIRVYGTLGGLRWRQETPETLELTSIDGPTRTFARGGPGLGPETQRASRLPGGHPEAFIEAFANVYRGATRAIRAAQGEDVADIPELPFATAADGERGVRFIEAAVESSTRGAAWVSLAPRHGR